MNSEAFIDKEIAPRPKINRLPLLPARECSENEKVSDNYIIRQSVYSFGAVALLILFFIGYQYRIGLSEVALIPPDDGRLMSLVDSSGDVIKTDNLELYFKDSNGMMVGQMVKIASESEKTTPNQTVNNNDPATGRDLLVIVSKH